MKNKNIKIIFVDIDQTILFHHGDKHEYDKKSLRGLKKAQKRGVKVFLATARPYDSAAKTGIFKLFKPDGVISCNGGVACINNEIIYCDHLPKKVVKSVIDACEQLNIVAEVSTEFERYFTREKNEYVDGYFKVFYENLCPIRKDFKDKNVTALLVFSPAKLDRKFNKILGPEIHGCRFTEFGVDVTVHKIDKKDGITKVLKYYGYKKENAMSLGDSFNDLGMFEMTEAKIALGNADESLKNAATFVSKDIAHHGVYFALKEYNII